MYLNSYFNKYNILVEVLGFSGFSVNRSRRGVSTNIITDPNYSDGEGLFSHNGMDLMECTIQYIIIIV